MLLPVIILTLFWQSWLCVGPTNAADADILWRRATSMVKQGQVDLAFSNFRMIATSYPTFSKSSAVRLVLGEYYFLNNDLRSAHTEFEYSYTKYPKDKESLIALAYLYKMSQTKGDQEKMDFYQKALITLHPLALVFKDSKLFELVSEFKRHYKVEFFIDRIEVSIDGRLFVAIPC
jgi:hypothetical protein